MGAGGTAVVVSRARVGFQRCAAMVMLLLGLTGVGLPSLVADAPPAAATLLPLTLALALAAVGGWRFLHRDLRLP